MSTPTQLLQTTVVQIPTFNQLVPKEGPKAIPLSLDFSVTSSYYLDYQNMQARAFMSEVQCLFIDNSNNNAQLTVLINGTFQLLKVDAFTQGYYPVLVPSPIRLTFSTPQNAALGGATGTPVSIFLMNIPMAGAVWTTAVTGSSGGSGGSIIPNVVGNRVEQGLITATAAGVLTGAPGFYVTAISFYLSQDATIGAAGEFTVLFQEDGGAGDTPIWSVTLNLPAAPGGAIGALSFSTPPGFFYNAFQSGSALDVVLSTPLTGGKLSYNINYGLWSFVG